MAILPVFMKQDSEELQREKHTDSKEDKEKKKEEGREGRKARPCE
jgi:hypothetical protein